ncbi:MAG: hypothetical protein A3G02_00185 [Candidatus Yanofskybacteria bacterium RIFCSPLOWO2_12_FULL_44_13b]|uniref:Uncharacterized protein n=1 Tax=Candidatus Yanofskybacteria bacterium RIFCSPLOWO2_02_FULL_44_18 TaxID=1802705 RepID=A0A1F8H0R7_9BACT|nr:MAG: hypothetical protein A2657_01030 [Candidatus Yanofskybacteria bacterium RIFCSPHIGHO2_01_FULL_44_110b]OGN15168.1 MAG: hypothetical protein A3C01_01855 [Candidatus Yanofskybacteria bacterium RIFCSPHIGHO2_02_FULL_44_36b]OGN18445.1 MAG: hypothetical protein A3F50_01445 [Candidatus Yanofskybacteria bacterium RIFCSPHIGHO2_12_FULL_44_29b]OGN26596.1 MAG: hypothetical protein A3B12_01185 [Candidatus Yanofskybacteria bacterium RIFCSPLOWO2_01_FULL_44_88]OGN31273.1 MAG: hypothetical protein A3I96_0
MATKSSKKIVVPQDSDIGGAIEISDFKQSLVDTLQESNMARAEMKAVLHEILKQPDTITEIKDIIDKTDRDSVKAFWSKFGFTVWSAIVFILGVIATVLMQNYLNK